MKININNNVDKNYALISLALVLIPILWIVGLKFLILQLISLGLIIINFKEFNKMKFSKVLIIAISSVCLFIISNILAIVINPLKFPLGEFLSSFYHLSYWVSGMIIIFFIYNSKPNKESLELLKKSIFLLCIFQLIIFIFGIIQWNIDQKWVSNEALLYNLLPDRLQIDFFKEVMTLNIVVEDPIINDVFFRFNGFYVYPVAAGLGSLYLLIGAFFTKVKSNNNAKKNNIIKIIILISLFACIYYSKSRMVILAPIIAIAVTILFYILNKRNYKTIALVTIGGALVLFIVLISTDAISLLLNARPESSSDRLNQYNYALQTVLAHPIFGVGDKFKVPGSYLLIGSHSTYINILVRSGFVGLFAILVFLGSIISQIFKNKKYITSRKSYKIWLATSFLFFTTLVWMFTEEIDWPQIVALFFFLNIALIFKFKDIANLYQLKENYKVGFITSSGGHLTHLIQLSTWWTDKQRFWVTFEKIDATSILKNENVYWCYYPTNRNIKNLVKNTFLAIKVLFREKPDVLISTGAAVAIPFYYLGKIYGCKLVYIEVYDRIDSPTLTGKIVYPICDEFIIQWEEQNEYYKKSTLLGGLF